MPDTLAVTQPPASSHWRTDIDRARPGNVLLLVSWLNNHLQCTDQSSIVAAGPWCYYISEDNNHHHNWFTALFWDHPGEPVPEENLWTLWCKGRLTEADTVTIRLGATLSGLTSVHLYHPPHIFYRPDALPAAQPTASKHWRQLAYSD